MTPPRAFRRPAAIVLGSLPFVLGFLHSCAAPPAAELAMTRVAGARPQALAHRVAAPATPVDAPGEAPPDVAVRGYGAPAAPRWAAATATATHTSFAAARAIDGDAGTEWGSGQVAGATLTLRLAAEAELAGVAIKTGPTPAGARYWLEASADGTTWAGRQACRNASWTAEPKAFAAPVRGRFVRLRFEAGARPQAFAVFEVRPTIVAASAPVATPKPIATPAPVVVPVPTATPVAQPPSSTTAIVVDPTRVLHAAESRLLGTNRNHVAGHFPNGAAKLAKLRELRPTWGDRKYLYRIGHGPTDGRHDYGYMTGYHFERTWDSTAAYPYDDIREGLKEAAALGADQMHVINYGTGTPEEAGRYVSYLNKADDANRAKYPFAQQNVKMFELGNEIPWSMVRGHAEHAAIDAQYAARAKKFAVAMRASSDVPIRIGAVASINSNWEGNGWSGGAKTVETILTTMGDQVDFLIYHGYPSWPLWRKDDLQTLMAQNAWNDDKLTTVIEPAIRRHAGGRDVRIANTEFFTHLYNDPERSRGLFGALYAADTLTLAFNHRMLSAVEFCLDHGDLADAAFFRGDDPARTTPIFAFQRLLATRWGDRVVATSGRGLPTKRVEGAATTLAMPVLAHTAAATDDKVFVMVTNRTDDTDVTTDVEVGFAPRTVTAHVLSDPAGWAARDAAVRTTALPSLHGVAFPRASVTILELSKH